MPGRLLVAVSATLLLIAACSGGGSSSSSSPAETPGGLSEPSVATSTSPAPAGPGANSAQVKACLDAWTAEKRASDEGVLDDATLRATARACPDLATWAQIRDQVGYGSTSPSLLRALCAFEGNSPVCADAKRQGAVD